MAPSAVAPSAATPAVTTGLFSLPTSVVGPVDLGRLIRETQSLDNELMQQELRGSEQIKLPKTSRLLDRTVELNKLDMLKAADRKLLIAELTKTHDKAPTLHISFSADPSPLFIENLMSWLRKEISPQVLLTIGEQPSIGAGCVVRTTNKYFDFSLRQDFLKKRDVLLEALRGAGSVPQKDAVAPVAPTPQQTPPSVRAIQPATTVHQRIQS